MNAPRRERQLAADPAGAPPVEPAAAPPAPEAPPVEPAAAPVEPAAAEPTPVPASPSEPTDDGAPSLDSAPYAETHEPDGWDQPEGRPPLGELAEQSAPKEN